MKIKLITLSFFMFFSLSAQAAEEFPLEKFLSDFFPQIKEFNTEDDDIDDDVSDVSLPTKKFKIEDDDTKLRRILGDEQYQAFKENKIEDNELILSPVHRRRPAWDPDAFEVLNEEEQKNSTLSLDDVITVMKALQFNQHVHQLNLCLCGLDYGGLSTIANYIQGVPIKYTNLNSFFFKTCSIFYEDMIDFLKTLSQVPKKGIELFFGNIYFADDAAILLADLLVNNSLKKLSLYHTNGITDQGGKVIAEGLGKNKSLEFLQLDSLMGGNTLTDKTYMTIVESLLENSSLKYFETYDDVSLETLEAFASLLKNGRRGLCELTFLGTFLRFEAKACAPFLNNIKYNKSLVMLDLDFPAYKEIHPTDYRCYRSIESLESAQKLREEIDFNKKMINCWYPLDWYEKGLKEFKCNLYDKATKITLVENLDYTNTFVIE